MAGLLRASSAAGTTRDAQLPAHAGSPTVSVPDPAAVPPPVTDTIPVGAPPPGVAVTGARAYVTNPLSDTVSVINTAAVPPAVVDTIAEVPTAAGDRPVEPVVIQSIDIAAV